MIFWLTTAVLGVLVTLLIVGALLRGRKTETTQIDYDVQVYRDQLKEVERDLARGVISAEDAERTRIEVSRRILESDKDAHAHPLNAKAPKALSITAATLATLVILGGAFGIYLTIGAPGYPDMPLKTRIADAEQMRLDRPLQSVAEAEALPFMPKVERDPSYVELVEKLREAVASRPDDLRGQLLLVNNEAALGNYALAHQSQSSVIAIKGDTATAQDYADYADLMIMAAGGYVSPEAETALAAALSKDAKNGTARYYSGLMFAQTGRPDMSFRIWRQLLDEGPADAPWINPIRAQIVEASIRAGVEYELPAEGGLAGPSLADVEAAADMTAEDRQGMIRGMVANLSERLATEGGTPQEWARLVGAYGVLGETDRAAEIWAEAQKVFATRPEALEVIGASAKQAGLIE